MTFLLRPIPVRKADVEPGSTMELQKSQCDSCWWRVKGTINCDAFPNGIPEVILLNLYDHKARYITAELDDGGVTYTKAP